MGVQYGEKAKDIVRHSAATVSFANEGDIFSFFDLFLALPAILFI